MTRRAPAERGVATRVPRMRGDDPAYQMGLAKTGERSPCQRRLKLNTFWSGVTPVCWIAQVSGVDHDGTLVLGFELARGHVPERGVKS